jgi:hypothetical protein
MGRMVLLLAIGAFLAAMAGCSLCSPCRRSDAPWGCRGDEAPLPTVERDSQEQAIGELAASVQSLSIAGDLSAPNAYRALTPLQCRCLAAQHAPLADGFDDQRRRLEKTSSARRASKECLCSPCGRTKGRKAEKQQKQQAFQEALLLYSALEDRNQAAGAALEWYYQLAGAEAKADLLNASLEYNRNTLRRIEEMQKLGIPLPAPLEEYQRQMAEMQLQQGQNQLTIEQLNSKLRLALGHGPKSAWRIWPDPGMPLNLPSETPLPLVPDVEAEVQLGLHQRPQLLLLRSAVANLDRDTLGSARILLQTINPLLAMSPPGPSCKLLVVLGKILHIQPGQEEELQRIRAQLCDYLCERERTVEAEVRAAVYEIGARRETILRARQAADSWQARIRDLEKQQAEGLKGALSLASAYLEWYKARGEVVKEFTSWKIAFVKLKQAQGVLSAECGPSVCKEN